MGKANLVLVVNSEDDRSLGPTPAGLVAPGRPGITLVAAEPSFHTLQPMDEVIACRAWLGLVPSPVTIRPVRAATAARELVLGLVGEVGLVPVVNSDDDRSLGLAPTGLVGPGSPGATLVAVEPSFNTLPPVDEGIAGRAGLGLVPSPVIPSWSNPRITLGLRIVPWLLRSACWRAGDVSTKQARVLARLPAGHPVIQTRYAEERSLEGRCFSHQVSQTRRVSIRPDYTQ